MEDGLVFLSVVCVSGFNVFDGCKLVCVVVLHVIKHGTREKNRSSLGTTRIHTFYIGDPAFEHAAMSNNDLVQMSQFPFLFGSLSRDRTMI